jgi:transcriptional regulator NrdR family protein
MNCPSCGEKDIRVKETRSYRDPNHDFYYVERRRVCQGCGLTFKTVEVGCEVWSAALNGDYQEGVVTFGDES